MVHRLSIDRNGRYIGYGVRNRTRDHHRSRVGPSATLWRYHGQLRADAVNHKRNGLKKVRAGDRRGTGKYSIGRKLNLLIINFDRRIIAGHHRIDIALVSERIEDSDGVLHIVARLNSRCLIDGKHDVRRFSRHHSPARGGTHGVLNHLCGVVPHKFRNQRVVGTGRNGIVHRYRCIIDINRIPIEIHSRYRQRRHRSRRNRLRCDKSIQLGELGGHHIKGCHCRLLRPGKVSGCDGELMRPRNGRHHADVRNTERVFHIAYDGEFTYWGGLLCSDPHRREPDFCAGGCRFTIEREVEGAGVRVRIRVGIRVGVGVGIAGHNASRVAGLVRRASGKSKQNNNGHSNPTHP